jgi:hypothetical protein
MHPHTRLVDLEMIIYFGDEHNHVLCVVKNEALIGTESEYFDHS